MSSIIEYNDVELLRKEHVVLKHVTFDVQPGEMVYLIGSVGSGKSTPRCRWRPARHASSTTTSRPYAAATSPCCAAA